MQGMRIACSCVCVCVCVCGHVYVCVCWGEGGVARNGVWQVAQDFVAHQSKAVTLTVKPK